MVLVTHNTADFERMKEKAFLRVEDWFTAQPNYFIGNKDIRGCIACGRCGQLGKCVFDDAVNEFAPKFKDADGLVVGSPVYYSALNATMQAFLQRLFYSASFDKTMKVGAGFVCARRGGAAASFDLLNKFFSMGKRKLWSSRKRRT